MGLPEGEIGKAFRYRSRSGRNVGRWGGDGAMAANGRYRENV